MTARHAALASWAALIGVQLAWYLWLAPPANGRSGLALALVLPPLLLPLLAWRNRPQRALLWVGLIAMAYFCHGIVAAWALPSARVPAVLEIASVLGLIAAIGFGGRRRNARSTGS